MARKGIASITISGTGFTNAAVVGATSNTGESVELDKIAAYGDTRYTSVPRRVKTYSNITVTILDEGGASSTLPAVGTIVSATITWAFNSGAEQTDTSRSITRDCVVASVEPGGEVTVDGDRKATVSVTLTPHAPPATTGNGENQEN